MGLEETDRRIQDVVATVSHELRTPLTVIEGTVELLEARWDALPIPLRDDLVSRMTDNATRLDIMATSLLRHSAAEASEVLLDRRVVPLRAHCQELVDRMRDLLRSISITLDIPPSLRVWADPDLLDNVFENLLTNCVKYTPHGTPVVVGAQQLGDDRALVRVSDAGPGIPPEDLESVTEAFYRARHQGDRDTHGLGLGLALVQRLVRLHGSALRLKNDDGLVVSFDLPRAERRHGGGRD